MTKETTLYLAAPLFSASEAQFNERLDNALTTGRQYKTILPQRDGFEFVNLNKIITEKIDGSGYDFGEQRKREIDAIAKNLIYYLDMGLFIPQSDVILANVDEPVDPGVIVEMMHAKSLGKSVIGYRTDLRGPYGGLNASYGGLHTFVTNQMNHLINLQGHFSECIYRTIAREVTSYLSNKSRKTHELYNKTVEASLLLDNADLLFNGIEDIKSQDGLQTVVDRYLSRRLDFEWGLPPR